MYIMTFIIQVCTLLKCQSTDIASCGESVEEASTRFESFSLSGNFSTSYVFPEVLLTQINLAPELFQVCNCIYCIVLFYVFF